MQKLIQIHSIIDYLFEIINQFLVKSDSYSQLIHSFIIELYKND